MGRSGEGEGRRKAMEKVGKRGVGGRACLRCGAENRWVCLRGDTGWYIIAARRADAYHLTIPHIVYNKVRVPGDKLRQGNIFRSPES